ncbi:MAG: Outer membrane porin F precursor [Smithella sp. PtaU1.Bin162]|nr:MAG: Outer membrane porin F precursor [Smithella sp. PtaU1.Bin162]
MKKIATFFVVISVLLITATGYAQVRAGSFNISPTLGMYTFEGNEDMDRPLAYGLRVGYNFTKYLGIEGFVHYGQPEINSLRPKERLDFTGYGVEGIFNILPDQKLVPFLAVGVGGVHYSSAYEFTTENKHDKIAVDYGYGLKYYFSDNFALRFDIRHIIPFDGTHNNMYYGLGLNFAFGGAKKTKVAEAAVKEEVVADADKDGVPDNLDKCPDTPAGVAVDKDGCPFDSDRDGVYDYVDKCPDTPVGVTVDKDGCPKQVARPVARPVVPPVVEESKVQAAQAAPEIVEKGRATLKVLFATNKDVIQKSCFKEIDSLAAVMNKYPDLKVTIEGHTDDVGSAAYNKKLSQKRAEAVKKYLVNKKGIDAKRLTAKGFGEEKPIASNKTKEGRQKNRRVEAAVDYVKK